MQTENRKNQYGVIIVGLILALQAMIGVGRATAATEATGGTLS